MSLRYHAAVHTECFAQSLRSKSMPYQGLISRQLHADFAQTSMLNLCGMHAESIYVLLRVEFTPILRRFPAEYFAKSFMESMRNPSKPYQGSILRLDFTPISPRVYPDFFAFALRNPCGINLCLIKARCHTNITEDVHAECFAESFRSPFMAYQVLISHEFHADST